MSAAVRLAVIVGVLVAGVVGWWLNGYPGAAIAVLLAALLGAGRWRRRQFWSWLLLWLRRKQPLPLADPITVANDRTGGGVRYQDGIAAVAVQVLGRAHAPTVFTGSSATETANTVDVISLLPLLRQSLGLTVESLSVVSAGARRRSVGDYPRVYDTLIGTPPYAGQRETWLIARIPVLTNVAALQARTSIGTAALAVGQRIAADLRQRGIRARVATASDIVEMERRFGVAALDPGNRRWWALRDSTGWLTSYGYRPGDLTAARLAQAWSLRADGIMQNITAFPDGTATATLTVRSAQPLAAPPSVALQPLPGEQPLALIGCCCGPRPPLCGAGRGGLPSTLSIPVGPSGVLLGKVGAGNRLMLPLDDPADVSRVHLAAADPLTKRIIVRLAASGERITVHSRDLARWASIRMPNVVVTEGTRPAAGTTIGVMDGTVATAHRPNTVISVGAPGTPARDGTDVQIVEIGPALLEVTAAGQSHRVEVELFRAENRYLSAQPVQAAATEAAAMESADVR